jgi:hypothetical protein
MPPNRSCWLHLSVRVPVCLLALYASPRDQERAQCVYRPNVPIFAEPRIGPSSYTKSNAHSVPWTLTSAVRTPGPSALVVLNFIDTQDIFIAY